MAHRPSWRGYLKLSLVTCPVAMLPATSESQKVSFHTLNRATGNRVRSRYVDADSGAPVDDQDQVKGYERGEGEYVMLEDEELEAVALESTRTIDIEMFVPADAIGWIWYDTPHFLVPDEKIGEEAFAVIREAMAAAKTRAVSRLVLHHRERPVLIEPHGKGMVLWTLRYGEEVRDEQDYFGNLKEAKPARQEMALMKNFMEQRLQPWRPEFAQDPVQKALLDMIAKKERPAKARRTRPAAGGAGNVVDLMAVLKKSLQDSGGR